MFCTAEPFHSFAPKTPDAQQPDLFAPNRRHPTARFKRPFLHDHHGRNGGGGEIPLDFICTYLIASTLLPALPRRGLRALAGYFGHVMSELKRATAHVSATAIVWSELLRALVL